MRNRFTYLPVFDNPELNGGGSAAPDPVAPEPVTPDLDDSGTPPDDTTPLADGGAPVMVPLAKAQAEKARRKAAEERAQTAETQAAYYRGLAERPAAPVAPSAPVKPDGPPEPPVQPTPSQFEDYDDFEAADTLFKQADRKYIVDLARYEARQEFSNQSHQQQRHQTETQVAQAFQGRLKEEAALDPDIITLATTFHLPGPNQLPLTGEMQDAIRESDVGPKLLRHFANNRAEVLRLAALSPATQLREIGKIEAAIINKPQPAVKRVTTAPEPIKPVGGGDSSNVDEDKMPMSEYLARERAKLAAQRKRS